MPEHVRANLADVPRMDLIAAAGDLTFAVVPEKTGIVVVAETGCGFLPVMVAFGVTHARTEIASVDLEQELPRIGEQLKIAQEDYHGRNGRFAQSLSELHAQSLLNKDLSDGIHHDFLYRIRPTREGWIAEFKAESTGNRFQYDPVSGKVTEIPTPGG